MLLNVCIEVSGCFCSREKKCNILKQNLEVEYKKIIFCSLLFTFFCYKRDRYRWWWNIRNDNNTLVAMVALAYDMKRYKWLLIESGSYYSHIISADIWELNTLLDSLDEWKGKELTTQNRLIGSHHRRGSTYNRVSAGWASGGTKSKWVRNVWYKLVLS